jgi:hypothetical protein
MRKSDFKKWLITNYPHLKEVTINTTVSDAFFIFTHNIGITLEEILKGSKTLDDYKDYIKRYLLDNGKKPGTRPSGYASHFKYLIEYAHEMGFTSLDSPIIKTNNNDKAKRHRIVEVKSHSISPSEIEEVFFKVEKDPIYGMENKLLKQILLKFPEHKLLEEVICKISVIDVTHSTHVGIHKKKFSLVDLANMILSINDIDRRIQSGDSTLVDEIATLNGVNLLSFASKYCACHNQMVYGRDDYFKFDSIVSKAIEYKGRNYTEYSKKLNDIIASNNLVAVNKVREKIDLYFWYNSKL